MSDATVITNRLSKNFKHREKWARKNNIEAFRIYERDIPDFPFIVDKYKDYLVVYERRDEDLDQGKEHHYDYLIKGLSEVTNTAEEYIITKSRFRQSGNIQYEKLSETNKYFSVQEHQAHFLVNVFDYLDTGLFLDHRPMRQVMYKESHNKNVLNLFCYTGSVSVVAALGGAKKVTSVDMSGTYLDWAKENFMLNKLSPQSHVFVQENALEYLQKCNEGFDIIFLDPPTFSNSKRMKEDFEVEKDQEFLVQQCMRLLNPDGVFYFSCNKRKFKLLESFRENYHVKDITKSTIPEDFRDEKIHHCFKFKHK